MKKPRKYVSANVIFNVAVVMGCSLTDDAPYRGLGEGRKGEEGQRKRGGGGRRGEEKGRSQGEEGIEGAPHITTLGTSQYPFSSLFVYFRTKSW